MSFPKFQTVEWWIEQLKEFNPKAKVKLLTSGASPPKCMLGMYPKGDHTEETAKTVFIDIGEPN